MVKLIEVEALCKKINDWYNRDEFNREKMVDLVDVMPKVEIIHCKDCEFWDKERNAPINLHACAIWSVLGATRYTAEKEFCSRAQWGKKDGSGER